MRWLAAGARPGTYNGRMKRLLPTLLILFLLVSCAPTTGALFSPPTFRLADGGGPRLVRIDPPGVGSGAAVFRFDLEVYNPNPVGLRLAALDGDLWLGGTRAAASSFPAGVTLAAGGTEPLVLELEVPLAGAPNLVTQLARLVTGETVWYRLDGALALDVFGTTQRLPTVTLVEGAMTQPFALQPPRISFDPAASGVRLEGLSAVIEVGLEITNPLPIGYLLRAPQLGLVIDGRSVATAGVPATPVPAGGSGRVVVRFDTRLPDLGAALAARLQGGGAGLNFDLSGELALEAPGIRTESFRIDRLVTGALR